ncbi:MAG: hypothetical protein JST39_13060, partial [Bacteroidetes bacterium]|nr:hypothetical protein [Bacteroidota bacterium]
METALQRLLWKPLMTSLAFLVFSTFVNAQLSYSFVVNTAIFTANSSPTSLISNNVDDAISGATSIGFNFTYNCNSYSQFMVSSNGWMVLGSGMTSSLPNNNLTTKTQGPILAPLWDDMQTSNSGKVDYQLAGSAGSRVLTIEWLNMKWDKNAAGPVMSYQVKLYEATGVVEFWYRRDANTINNGSASIGISGGSLATDFYSVDATPATTFGTDAANLNTRPTGNRVYKWTPSTPSYSSTTTTQASTASVTRCNPNDQVVLGLQIVTSGGCNQYAVSQIKMDLTGTTATGFLTDVSKIHIYYTGLSSGFAPVNEFVAGGMSSSLSTITFNGSQTLMGGTNYFWIAYDLTATAVIGDVIDGRCTSVTISGGPTAVGTVTPSTTAPAGSRSIVNCSPA